MFDITAYGKGLAAVYDQLYPSTPDAGQAARFIRDESPGKRVLELGVGTGRLALELASLGTDVHGIDASAEMLERLAERDPDRRVTTVLGDFTESLPDGPFDAGLIGLNTLFMVPDQEKQIATLRLLGSRLVPSGVVFVETYDPWYYHRLTEARVEVHHLQPDRLMIDQAFVSRPQQRVVIFHSILAGGAPSTVVEVSRYAWPCELDLMARLAGLRLRARYAGWNREPVTADSTRYVSVFEVTDAGD